MTGGLSDPEMMRSNRQIVLRGVDFEGQEALQAASAIILGRGGGGGAGG
ncbi:molybdopterin-synthase adenylyltransferase MoeB, partial [Enterobacter hormaechei]|nr:molybdopterin-synthase adenylyltransferase MoeB [Enterobacter hormaechei]